MTKQNSDSEDKCSSCIFCLINDEDYEDIDAVCEMNHNIGTKDCNHFLKTRASKLALGRS